MSSFCFLVIPMLEMTISGIKMIFWPWRERHYVRILFDYALDIWLYSLLFLFLVTFHVLFIKCQIPCVTVHIHYSICSLQNPCAGMIDTPKTRTFPLFNNQEYLIQTLLSVSETQRWLGGARWKQNKTKTTYSMW